MGAIYNTITALNESGSFAFNEAYQMPPTAQGTLASNLTTYMVNEGTAPVFESSNGPISTEGSWRFQTVGGSYNTRIRHQGSVGQSTAICDVVRTDNYTMGFWLKMNSLSTTMGPVMTSTGIHRALTTEGGSTLSNYTIFASNLASAGNPTYYGIGLGNTPNGNQIFTTDENGNQIVKDKWYFVALRTTTALVGGDFTRTQKFYINGALKVTYTNAVFSSGYINQLNWGFISGGPASADVNIADWFLGPAANISEADIVSIYNSSNLSANINDTALTASAMMTEPTLVITSSDYVKVTTSIPVSATFPESITVEAIRNINNVISGALEASTTIANNIQVSNASNISHFATPIIATATIMDPPTIISDNAVLISATPITASGEIPNPGYGPSGATPLWQLPGTLQSKIATYAIEAGSDLSKTVVIDGSLSNETSYGTRTVGGANIFNYHGDAYNSPTIGLMQSVAGAGPTTSQIGALQLKMPWRIRTAGYSDTGTNPFIDRDYAVGYWFKIDTLATGTSTEAMPLMFVSGASTTTGTALDFQIAVSGSSHSTDPNKLNLTFDRTTYEFFGTTLNTTAWNYLAVRRVGTTTNGFEVYLNGSLILVKTNTDTSNTYTNIQMGNNATASFRGTFSLQNYHQSTSTVLQSYDINQIWLAGIQFPPAAAINVSHASDRFLASATLVSPTIVAVKGDHVEVTTSVTVSSLMPEASWSTGTIVTFNTGFFGGIQADIGDNVQVETNGDKSISPVPFTSTAIFPEPILSRRPALATASLPMPQIYIAPNYFQLVMNHNPVFYIEDGQATPTNYGSWQQTGWLNEYFTNNVQAGLEMDTIGNQKAWQANGPFTAADPRLQAIIPDYKTKVNSLYANGNLTIELWYTSIGYGNPASPGSYEESGVIFNDGITQIAEVWDFFGAVPGSNPQNKILFIAERLYDYDFNTEGAFATWRTFSDANPKRDLWNHLVVSYESVTDVTKIRRKIYLNGGIISNQLLTRANNNTNTSPLTGPFGDDGNFLDHIESTTWTGPQLGGEIQLSGSETIKLNNGVKLDEFAIYPKTLSGTQVIEHYNFIRSRKPSTEYNSTAVQLIASMGNHQVIPQRNAVYDEDPMPALASRIPEPTIIAGKSRFIFPPALEFNATIVNPSVITQSVYYAQPMLATGELLLPLTSNNLYYQYVQSNILPYRYAPFDTSNELFDYGSDAVYSVPPIQISGTVTAYKDGINNKSIKTSGTSYTQGVILKESDWNDSWGTGENSYHSAFWFQRAEDDASTTGLRVLWNLNGYKDNQHVVVYQYQNKIHMQFNNASGTWIEQDTGTLDLFDYQQHFIVVEFNHSSPNNHLIKLYVDSVLKITANIGTYSVLTTNSATEVLGPNDEANNHARLGVGCLITPFAATALPVVPTNTKLIIDEVYWDKSAITQTQVTNLFNTMPTKVKSRNFATPLNASEILVMPSISTGATFNATPMLAFPAQTEVQLYIEKYHYQLANALEANANITDSKRSNSRNISAEVMLATFGLGSAGTPRIIAATPLTVSIILANRTVTGVQAGLGNSILINGQRTFDPNSKWVQYVVSTTENTLIPMREVR